MPAAPPALPTHENIRNTRFQIIQFLWNLFLSVHSGRKAGPVFFSRLSVVKNNKSLMILRLPLLITWRVSVLRAEASLYLSYHNPTWRKLMLPSVLTKFFLHAFSLKTLTCTQLAIACNNMQVYPQPLACSSETSHSSAATFMQVSVHELL